MEKSPNSIKTRVLELTYDPLLNRRYPDQTTWISTAFRWSDVRSYQLENTSTFQRLNRLAKQFLSGLRAAWKQDYDVVITRCLGSVNSYGNNLLIHLLRDSLGKALLMLALFASRGSRVKLVVLDFTDHITIHPRDRQLLWKSDLYFKRELAHNYWQTLESAVPRGACAGVTQKTDLGRRLATKLRPISLGYPNDKLPPAIPSKEKTTDLFYSGTGENIPGRKALAKELEKLSAAGWRIVHGNGQLSRDEFQHQLSQSRLCLSPAGIGWDCYRHYEISAAGSVPLLEYRAIRQHAPYLHGEDAFYFDPQNDIATQLIPFLSTPDETLDQMVQNARNKLLNYHTFSSLAKHIMKEIERLDTQT